MKYIIEANTLLRSRHRSRLDMTPFCRALGYKMS